MNLFELSAKISMDTKDYEKAVKNAVSNSKSLKENFAKLAGQSETNANKIKVLASQYDSAKSKVAVLTTSFNKAAREEGVTAERTQKLAKELADAEKEADDLKNEMDSLSKKTKNTGDSVESLSDKLKKGLSTAEKVATGVLTTVATGVVALGKIGLEYNAQIESYTTDFEVMMGDAAAAAKKVEELKEMGAKTPFELGDLASATKTLLAFNVSADDSTGVLQQLGDISLGNVQKLESLTRAYGKMNASQKVTLEDINMMIDAGFNPLLIVAENTGETMTEVYDRISNGGVAFEEISAAINQATSEGGQFYQGMDKASQTTQGLISTLKDAAQSKIGELFSDISEKIKELLPNVISFIENIDTDEIVTGVENLMQTFNDLLPVITGVTAATVAYKTATSIAGIIDALRKATEGQTIAQALLNAVMNANPFVLIATLIAGLVAAVITLWNTNEGFRSALISAWEAIKSAATKIFSAVANFFTTTIPNAFNSVVNWFKDIGKKFADIGKNIVDGLKKGIQNAWSNLKRWFKNLFGDLIGIAKKILGIASPSKVFKKIGGFTAEGFGAGFEDEFAHVKDDMEDALNFDDASVGINASIRKVGAEAAGVAFGGTSIGNININIDGAKYSDEQSLASAIALEIQNMTDRRAAVYA